jgi:lipid A 3-O-deacylase
LILKFINSLETFHKLNKVGNTLLVLFKMEPILNSRLKRFLGLLFSFSLLIVIVCALDSHSARANDPDFLSVGVGWFDFNHQNDVGGEFRLEYRSDKKWWIFKPFVTAAATNHKMSFIGAGVLVDIYLGHDFVLTPSFSPTLWRGKTDTLDLGNPLEFRSQMELSYRFNNSSRLGLAISHYSNASLSGKNPGTETVSVYYSIPLNILFPSK